MQHLAIPFRCEVRRIVIFKPSNMKKLFLALVVLVACGAPEKTPEQIRKEKIIQDAQKQIEDSQRKIDSLRNK